MFIAQGWDPLRRGNEVNGEGKAGQTCDEASKHGDKVFDLLLLRQLEFVGCLASSVYE